MMSVFSNTRDKMSNLAGESQHRNAVILIADQVLLGLLGFMFWWLMARHTAPSNISTANATVGLIGILAMASTLGLPNTLLRYTSSEKDGSGFIKIAGVAVVSFSLVLATAWVLSGLGISHTLDWADRIGLIVGVVMTALGALGTYGLMAHRQAQYVLYKDMFGMSSRYAFIFGIGLTGLSAAGMVNAIVLGATVAAITGFSIAARRRGDRIEHNWSALVNSLKTKIRFALGNHVSAIIASVPALVLPAIMVGLLGAHQAAFFTVPLLIVGVVNVIPQSMSNSMLAEMSHGGNPGVRVIRALKGTYVFLVPGVLVMVIIAPLVLGAFGSAYREGGTTCLRFMLIGALFAGANYIGDSLLLGIEKVRLYTIVNLLGTLAVLAWTMALSVDGPSGIGLGWLLGQVSYLAISVTVIVAAKIPRSL